MVDAFDLSLSPNDKFVTAAWRCNNKPIGRVQMRAGDFEDYSDQIRRALTAINEYVQRNPTLSLEEDADYREYNRLLKELREQGKGMRDLLVGLEDPRNRSLVERVSSARNAELTIFVDDENVTAPVSFACDEDRNDGVSLKPSQSDFDQFWLSKFSKISTWLNSSSASESKSKDERSRALYAADRDLWQAAHEIASERWPQFSETLARISEIDCGCQYSWDDAGRAWKSILDYDNILVFFGHSDGTSISVSGQEKHSAALKTLFSKQEHPSSTLLIANTCMSLAGNRRNGTSIVSLSARAGFAGLIGTEAEISNDYALLCCSRLINDLFFEGCELGEAFDNMRSDPTLFPLNLFYTCYGDRNFRLSAPLSRSTPRVLA
jgi:hypothetical protein